MREPVTVGGSEHQRMKEEVKWPNHGKGNQIKALIKTWLRKNESGWMCNHSITKQKKISGNQRKCFQNLVYPVLTKEIFIPFLFPCI